MRCDAVPCRALLCRAVPCLPDAFGWFRSRRFGPRMAGLCGSRSARKASSYESITQPHTLLPPRQGPISPTHSEHMRSEAHSSQATNACGTTHLSTLTHTRARTRTSTHTRARTQRALPTGRTRACARSPLLQVLRADGRALVAAARADLGGTTKFNSHGYPVGSTVGRWCTAMRRTRHGRFGLSCCGWTGGGAAG